MRVKLNFTENKEIVPIHNQSKVNGYIHKCLGYGNQYHDSISNYSISSLQGGKITEDKLGLNFKNGSFLLVSSNDLNFIRKLLMGIMENSDFLSGMSFRGVDYISEEFYDGLNHFSTLSPFILKEKVNRDKYRFVTIGDDDFQNKIKMSIIRKIESIYPDLSDQVKDIEIIYNEHPSHKVKKIMVKNVINVANQCQITIKCTKKVAKAIWILGIGNSCGSGFGCLRKTENKKLYF